MGGAFKGADDGVAAYPGVDGGAWAGVAAFEENVRVGLRNLRSVL